MTDGIKRGLFAIAVTPFDAGGAIDCESIPRLYDFYVGHGATAIIGLGIMGEAHRLTTDEALRVGRAFLKAARGVPTYFGVSNPAPHASALLAKSLMADGAAGVMLAPLVGQRSAAQVRNYLETVIGMMGDDVPVVLQDYPQETDTWLSATDIAGLIDTFPSLCALKHEECPGLAKLSSLRGDEHSRRVREFPIFAGNGAILLPQELARGADGAMTGYSFPEVIAQTCALAAEGRIDAAEDRFDRHLPLIRYEHQPRFGLAVRKYILQRRGAIAGAHVRVPGYRLDATDIAEIERLIERVTR
ncbi:MAG: dihydrodipicolinate synthase family protein [Rhizomicrobium sp.]